MVDLMEITGQTLSEGVILQVIAASLLLFKKTRTIGILITIGILTNVVAINFSFDISVKIYATFLFFLAILNYTSNKKSLSILYFTTAN